MNVQEPPGPAERITAALVFCCVALLFAFYGVYWVQTLVPLTVELDALAQAKQGVMAAQGAFHIILAVWQVAAGETLVAARLLSLLAAVAALVMTFRLGWRLSGDRVIAAFLCLSFVFYPPLVATFSIVTPHALFALLCLAVLDLLLTSAIRNQYLFGGMAGVLSGLAVMLLPLGSPIIPLWLLLCGLVAADMLGAVLALMLSLATALVAWLLGVMPPVFDADLSLAGHDTLTRSLLLPYGMVWVSVLLGGLAVCSTFVRQTIGHTRAMAVVAAPLFAAGLLLAGVALGKLTTGQLLTAFAAVFPFALLAPWPLILWVRRIMPNVKSLFAWLVFPVVMYSCFWVVLGPVRPAKFPYSYRYVPQPMPADPRSLSEVKEPPAAAR